MKNESSQEPLGQMNRRTMLGTTTALIGGAIAGAGSTGVAARAAAAPAAKAGTSPNLDPPVVQVKGGKLRGLREGKTLVVPRYPVRGSGALRAAEAGGAVDRDQERPGLGAGLPGAGTDHGRQRRAGLPAPLLGRQRALPVPERLHPERDPGDQEAGDGLVPRRRLHQRLVDGVLRLRRPQPERVRRRGGRQRQPPAEYHRHAGPLGLRPAVRQLALHGHRGSRWPRSSGCATTSRPSAAIPGT